MTLLGYHTVIVYVLGKNIDTLNKSETFSWDPLDSSLRCWDVILGYISREITRPQSLRL